MKKRKRHPNPYLPPLPHRDRVRGQRGTQIYLPPLDAEQAWSVVIVLEHIIHTIWRTHGDAMADYQARVWPDLPPPPDAQIYRSITPDDDDQPF